ncbi:heme oxygenase-like protein [Pleomassaria siparia CBS 279.74]|uniref:Heme oxygenase-like protein n=1 Tax=Pleomassaria siparia CBS 279.74 TaxID=1314801 RepID=A0A6G1KGK8_9PLEO|nr:heme oxygenase-like protein [Pleomassaria siparia CBS 279.74]
MAVMRHCWRAWNEVNQACALVVARLQGRKVGANVITVDEGAVMVTFGRVRRVWVNAKAKPRRRRRSGIGIISSSIRSSMKQLAVGSWQLDSRCIELRVKVKGQQVPSCTHANPDIRRAFQEFNDNDTPTKCNKVRCLHCGFVRAKNTTRQIEHLQECQSYLASPEAQVYLAAQAAAAEGASIDPNIQHTPAGSNGSILTGQRPNPNLQVHRRGPNSKRARDGQLIAPNMNHQHIQPQLTPSLTSHLLNKCNGIFKRATQQPFLSHAGCGSLAAGPLSQWLVQDAHYARGYMRFVGQLLAKIRLPQTTNSQFHPMYRTMDLLISALNNMRREMQFFEITATKYGLVLSQDQATPITRALLDLFVSASSSSASLLEGMVVLWAIEHAYRSAWQYASSFSTSLSTPSTENHNVALQQALIPNWTSPAFSKFVDATQSLVDELANITTAHDGKEEMIRCEEIFRQICWLEERSWPDVDGMGEEDETARLGPNLGPLGAGVGGMDNGLGGSNMGGPVMNGPGMNGSGMNGPGMNGPVMNSGMGTSNMNGSGMNNNGMNNNGMNNNGMNNNGMNGPMSAGSMNGTMNGPMNTNGMDSSGMNGSDGTPVSDGRNSFSLPHGGLEGVGPSS